MRKILPTFRLLFRRFRQRICRLPTHRQTLVFVGLPIANLLLFRTIFLVVGTVGRQKFLVSLVSFEFRYSEYAIHKGLHSGHACVVSA